MDYYGGGLIFLGIGLLSFMVWGFLTARENRKKREEMQTVIDNLHKSLRSGGIIGFYQTKATYGDYKAPSPGMRLGYIDSLPDLYRRCEKLEQKVFLLDCKLKYEDLDGLLDVLNNSIGLDEDKGEIDMLTAIYRDWRRLEEV